MRKFNEICKSVENMDVLTYSAVLAKKSLEILPALNEITEDEIDAVTIFATFIIFLLLYKFMPKRRVTFKSQIWGAVFGAIALNVVSFVFSKYLDIFKGFSITYGSLTTLMLVMMWTYSCFYTVFLGAELNKILNILKIRKMAVKKKLNK